MGTCLSKKKGSSSSSSPVAETKSASASAAPAELKKISGNAIAVSKPKVETEPEVNLKKDKEPVQEDEGVQKKEIFIIKHRKSHDDRERNSQCTPPVRQNASLGDEATNNEGGEFNNKTVPAATIGVGVRTSSCTKEEVDAILIQCGRLSRSSSGKAASSSSAAAGERRIRYSGSKRSYDFDHCDNDNDNTSANDDQKSSDLCEDDGEKRHHQHRPRSRQSPRRPSSSQGRRRTPSRERDQQQNQRSSSRERRVSRSPGRRSSESSNPTNTNTNTNTNPASAIASNNNSNSNARPGKMVSVPPTVSSLVMDKSNNGGGGGESGGNTGIKRISVKRNVGENGVVGSRTAASPRSRSPARASGNGCGNAANSKALGENLQKEPSLSRNSSRKAEHSPYRRNPLSEIDPNSIAYPQSANNKKPNVEVNDNTKSRKKGVEMNCKPKEQEEEAKGHFSVTENVVVKTVVPSGSDNFKPQTLTRSRSSRRSRDLDINPEGLLNHEPSYTSLLLEDIHNFHQKNTTTTTPSVSALLPACVSKACSILEAVADLNSTTSSNLSGPFSEERTTYQATRNPRVTDMKDFVESEVVVHDDVMEPSFHKYVTVKRGGGGVDMEDQESSGSNSFTVSGQQNWALSPSSWEPNSADSTDCWTSRSNPRECGVDEAKKKANGKRRECDHQHSNGIGRGRLGVNKGLHTISATAAAST